MNPPDPAMGRQPTAPANPWAAPGDPQTPADPAAGYRRTLILLAGVLPVVLALVVGAVVTVAAMAGRSGDRITAGGIASPSPSPSPPREPTTSDCAVQDGGHYVLAACAAAGAVKVLAAADYTAEASEVCPDATDLFGFTRSNDVLCIQNLAGAHPGAPGVGGGVLRAGDCLGNQAQGSFAEVPCGGPTAFHKVMAVAADAAKCPPGSIRTLASLRQDGKSIICGADGPGIATPGKCVAWSVNNAAFDDVPVPCTGKRPVAKFTGRAKTPTGCGRWARAGTYYYYVNRDDAIGPLKYNCYLKLG